MSNVRTIEEPAVSTYAAEELVTMLAALTSDGSGTPCDRNLKENIKNVDRQEVLSLLAGIPISTWNYKQEDPSTRHIGPMAQDFHAAFHVGQDDRHIHTIDSAGIALAAIQALYERSLEKDEQIARLQTKLSRLEDEVITLRAHQYVNGVLS